MTGLCFRSEQIAINYPNQHYHWFSEYCDLKLSSHFGMGSIELCNNVGDIVTKCQLITLPLQPIIVYNILDAKRLRPLRAKGIV